MAGVKGVKYPKEFGRKVSERMRLFNPMRFVEYREKVSESKRGCSSWNAGLTKETDVRVARVASKNVGRKATAETRRRLRLKHWSRSRPDEFRRRIVHGVLLRVGRHPNVFEQSVAIELEKRFPGEFEYCGNGTFCPGGVSVDFRSRVCSVVVFCNGWYWHLEKFGLSDTVDNRRMVEEKESLGLRKLGYGVWFVWEPHPGIRNSLEWSQYGTLV